MIIDYASIRPDEVSIEDYTQWENSTFSEVYKKAEQCFKQILSHEDGELGDLDQPFKPLNSHSNILAFVGDRGSGKTSAMISFVKACVEGKLPVFDARERQCVFYMLPIVEPSRLSQKETIVASVVAQIYSELEDYLRGSSGKTIDQALVTQIANQCAKVREAVRTQGLSPQDLLQESVDDFSQLSLLAQTKRLRESLRQLIDSYLKLRGQDARGHPVLILPVDDIDTSIPNAYRLTEELQNHLAIPNVVVTLALKTEQLSDALEQQFISEFRDLCQAQRLMDTRSLEMATKYLQKFIPPQRRIEMPALELYSVARCRVSLDHKTSQPLTHLFFSLVTDKTGILLVEDKEGGHPLIPRNLRALHQTLLFLQGMENVSELKGAQGRRTLLSQLDSLESWLLDGLNYLPTPLYRILRRFSTHSDEGLAAFLWRSISGVLAERVCAQEIRDLLGREIRNENISLGDILYLLTMLQQTDAEDCFIYFGSTVRLLYSIRIRRQLTAALSEELDSNVNVTDAFQSIPEEGFEQVSRILNGLIYDPLELITYDGLERMCNGDASSGRVAVPGGENNQYEVYSLCGGPPLETIILKEAEGLPANCMTLEQATYISLFIVGFGRVRKDDIHTLQESMLRGILHPIGQGAVNPQDLESGEPAFVSANWMAFVHNLLRPEDTAHRLLWQVVHNNDSIEEHLKYLADRRWPVLFESLHLDSVDFLDAVVRHMVEHTASVCQELEDKLAAMNGYFHFKAGLEKAVNAAAGRANISADTTALKEFLDGLLKKEDDENQYAKYNWLCHR